MICQVGGEHQRVSRDHQEGHHEADLIMEAIAPLMTRNRSTLSGNRRTRKRGKSSAKIPHGHSQRKCQLLVWSMVIGTRSLHRYSTTGSWRTSLSCLTTSGEGLTATAFVLLPVRTKEETLSIQINNPSRSTSMRKPRSPNTVKEQRSSVVGRGIACTLQLTMMKIEKVMQFLVEAGYTPNAFLKPIGKSRGKGRDEEPHKPILLEGIEGSFSGDGELSPLPFFNNRLS